MRQPRVSVLIPNYNCARYLPEAIESVLKQDFPNFELLLIDNASTDDSLRVIQRYAALDPRIRFEANPTNLGAVPNWNRCLAEAKGEYIKFLFSDDTLASPRTLTKMVQLLDAHPTAALVATARNIIDEHSRLLGVWDHLGAPGWYDGRDVALRCFEKQANLIGEPSAVMFRSRYARRGFNPQYFQLVDLEMWFHLLEQGGLVYTPEPLCSFRRHRDQLTEYNAKHKIGSNEMVILLHDYAFAKPWLKEQLTRKALFLALYSLRKHPDIRPKMQSLEQQVLERLGRSWFVILWVRHKLCRPFSNLKRWFDKHVFRRPMR